LLTARFPCPLAFTTLGWLKEAARQSILGKVFSDSFTILLSELNSRSGVSMFAKWKLSMWHAEFPISKAGEDHSKRGPRSGEFLSSFASSFMMMAIQEPGHL